VVEFLFPCKNKNIPCILRVIREIMERVLLAVLAATPVSSFKKSKEVQKLQ